MVPEAVLGVMGGGLAKKMDPPFRVGPNPCSEICPQCHEEALQYPILWLWECFVVCHSCHIAAMDVVTLWYIGPSISG